MKRDSNCFDPNWAVYFLWAFLQLYSITKPSANVQMRSIKDAITYGLRKANLGGLQTQDREKFLAPLQTTEVTRLISDFEKSDLQQAVDIN